MTKAKIDPSKRPLSEKVAVDSDHGRQLKEAERVNAYSLSNVYKSFGLLDDARDPPTCQLSDHLKVQVPGKSSGHRMGSVNSLFEFSELKPGHRVSGGLPSISDLKRNLCFWCLRGLTGTCLTFFQ